MFSNTTVPLQHLSKLIVERINQGAFFIGLILTGILGLVHWYKIKSASPLALLVLFTISLSLCARRGLRLQCLNTLLLILSFFEWLYLYGEIGAITYSAVCSVGLLSLLSQRSQVQHISLSCGILWSALSLLHSYFAKSPDLTSDLRIFSESAQPFIFWFAASLLPVRQTLRHYSLVSALLLALGISIMAAIMRHEYFYYFREADLSQIAHPVYLSGVILLCCILAIVGSCRLWSSVQRRTVWSFAAALLLLGLTSCSILALWTTRLLIPSFDFIQSFPKNITFLLMGDPGLVSHFRPPSMEHRAGILLLLQCTGIFGMVAWLWTVLAARVPLLIKVGILLLSLVPGFFTLAIFPLMLSLCFPLPEAAVVQEGKVSPHIRQIGVVVCGAIVGLFLLLIFSLQQHRAQQSTPVLLKSVPHHLIEQLLVAEDLLFLTHHGIDFARLKWVVRDTLDSGTFDRGASTLTMQLAKVRFLTYDKTLLRKLQQILLALYLEVTTSKKRLLEEYLSAVSFGPHVIGVDKAAQHYFGKQPSELNEREALLLILTIENPERFTPAVHPVPKAVRQKSQAVLRNRRLFSPLLRKQIRTMLDHD